MADFEIALQRIEEVEGGWSDRSSDRGGVTKFGISLRFLKSHRLDLSDDGIINDDDVRALTKERAREIYRRYFWQYDVVQSQEIATRLLDMAIHMGPQKAHEYLQTALVKRLKKDIPVDGIFGPKTLLAVNAGDSELLHRWLRAYQAVHYAKVVIADPTQREFLLGWMFRAVG